ncbi:MAG: hypothetical protein ABIC36_00505 [bacterium]
MKKILILILIIVCLLAILIIGKNVFPSLRQADATLLCENLGGELSDIDECNGDISQICSFPNDEVCYAEDLSELGCQVALSPKILCDNEQ